ncbi:MAG: SET domain-containing protein-lysine N-methyltransferase [Akkermansiaceae bacterium]|nr:SET domain-containing protein-lysine N-methyltransferase [Akkermansiaceae bacterium]
MSSKRKERVRKQQKLTRQMVKMWERAQSDLCEVRGSDIHGRGVYATTFIPKEAKIIEYVGEMIDKEESDRRGNNQHEHAQATGDAAVYIFTLNKHYDLDGNVPWNTARLINHSCDPNCEAWIDDDRVFIHALRDIQPGEELSFDYGFDIDCYEEHPCRCGKPNCVGYIVSQDEWPELRKRLAKKQASKATKKKSRQAGSKARK